MHRTLLLALTAVAFQLVAPLGFGHAGGTPGQVCAGAKLKATGKAAAASAGCHARAAKRGVGADAACLAKADAKLAAAFAKAEARGGCVTTGDAEEIGVLLDSSVAAFVGCAPPRHDQEPLCRRQDQGDRTESEDQARLPRQGDAGRARCRPGVSRAGGDPVRGRLREGRGSSAVSDHERCGGGRGSGRRPRGRGGGRDPAGDHDHDDQHDDHLDDARDRLRRRGGASLRGRLPGAAGVPGGSVDPGWDHHALLQLRFRDGGVRTDHQRLRLRGLPRRAELHGELRSLRLRLPVTVFPSVRASRPR